MYESLSQCFEGNQIFFVVDETSGHVEVPDNYNKVSFNVSDLHRLALFSDFNRVGWLCGDYFYYILREHVKAGYYWLVEPDVKFTYPELGSFFGAFDNQEHDFLAPLFGRKNPKWGWYGHARLISENVYGCIYPITRMSARAVDLLLKERQSLSKQFYEEGLTWRGYPNDESFSATILVKNGFMCDDMRAIQPDAFSQCTTAFPLPWETAAKSISSCQVVHPALEDDDFWVALDRKVKGVLNRSELRQLVETAIVGSDQKHKEKVERQILESVSVWLAG